MEPVRAGIVGCGDISDAYLSNDAFEVFEIVACSSRTRESAEAKAEEYGIEALAIDELLADPEIEIVVNLTPPAAHAEVSLRALEAGNHVYTEKPLAATLAEAREILETARDRELLVGSAPDTVLGAGLQTCRALIDEGRIGEPVGATAIWAFNGHEHWHPDPDFFYQEGGGPLFDMGPYYLTALVFLLGPATRVTGAVTRASDERTITSEPRRGETIDVDVPTHEPGLVEFENGASATVLMTFDVAGSSMPTPTFEIYGTEGTLRVPDPNCFAEPVGVLEAGSDEFEDVPFTHDYEAGRGAGIADLANTLRSDWEHRTSGALAGHVMEIMDGIRSASDSGTHLDLEPDIDRPAPLPREFPAEEYRSH